MKILRWFIHRWFVVCTAAGLFFTAGYLCAWATDQQLSGLMPGVIIATALAALLAVQWVGADYKKFVGVFLAASLLMVPRPAKPAIQVVVGAGIVAVIVGGGCAYVRAKRACQRKAARDRQRETNLLERATVDSAASWVIADDYCAEPAGIRPAPTVLRLSGDEGQYTTSASAAAAGSMTWTEFGAEMAGRGAPLVDGGMTYSRNGVPCAEAESEIQFATVDGLPCVVVRGAGARRVVSVERASSPRGPWMPLYVLSLPVGLRFEVSDTSEDGAGFLRVTETIN